MLKKTFHIRGMHCRSCELLLEAELNDVANVKRVKTHFHSGLAEIFFDKQEPKDAELLAAVQQAGYEIGQGERLWIANNLGSWIEALFAFGIVLTLFLFAKGLGLFDLSFGSDIQLNRLPFVFLLGLAAGFSTCMAIVGGLVLAVSARFSERHPEASVRHKFIPHIYFNLGRIGGFALLGALLGYIGSTFQINALAVGALTVIIGVIMVLVGLQLLELFPRLSGWKLTLPKFLARMLGIQSHTKKEYSHSRAMLLGMLTFFLPCGFTQLVQLFVVTQGSPTLGALTMGTFALGTAPGLLGIGGVAATAKGWFRRFFFKAAGFVVLTLGIFNVNNGSTLVNLGTTGNLLNIQNGLAVKNMQTIRITQKADGYFPNVLTVKKGQPVRLIVDSQSRYSCAISFMMPKAGIRKVLSPGEN